MDAGTAPAPDGPPWSLTLLWIPLGAGQHVVRLSGRIYETLVAARTRRPRCDLFHAALVADTPDGRVTIEVAPEADAHGERRGAVAGGPVGLRVAGRFRVFRYEIRRWPGGEIPDAVHAVDIVRLATDAATTTRVLDQVAAAPTPVWGRDELRTGDMWNSNSVVSWLLETAGVGTGTIALPDGGRAPGWDAGIIVARRSPTATASP